MSWLSGATIIEKIRRNANDETSKAFHCVYAIDKLPAFIPYYPFIIVVNTHTHNLSGEHWIVIFIDKDKSGELFDSLSLPVSNFVIRWMNKFTQKWLTNATAYQHLLSPTCGAFAIFYVLKRLSFSNFLSFKNVFTLNRQENEVMISRFYNSLK